MKNDYAVFIISHKRPEVETLKALTGAGYTGEYFIVVDDKDSTIEEYKSRYGEHVLVFSKEKMLEETDTIDNYRILNAAVYAMNYCIKYSREKGYKYIAIFDDDTKKIGIRYESEGKLKSADIKNFDKVLDLYISFLETSNFLCVSFLPAARLIGGLKSEIWRKKEYSNVANIFIIRTDGPYFQGSLYQDLTYSVFNNYRGKLVKAVLPVVYYQEPPENNLNGGLAETYTKYSKYTSIFHTVIACPSAVHIKARKDDIQIIAHKDAYVPKILGETWKK